MLIQELLRDSVIGQLVNSLSRGRLLKHPEDESSYEVPEEYLSDFLDRKQSTDSKNPVDLYIAEKGYILVDWDERTLVTKPHNWSTARKLAVVSLIMLLTFAVYIGASIYTASIPGLMSDEGHSRVGATAGLSIFVIGYGVGPIFLAPLQDIPSLGRNPTYIIGFAIYLLLQIPPLFSSNLAAILIPRFFAGFFGSPALATGGATMGDIFAYTHLPYAIGVWSLGATAGPVLGPSLGGFAAMAKGWKYPFYELLWLAGFTLAMLALFLPETLESTLLIRRAERLRRTTKNQLLRTRAEVEREVMGTGPFMFLAEAWKYFSIGMRMSLEPAVAFTNIYMGLLYACFYLWFESFPFVFIDHYGFNLGQAGLPFIAFIISAILTLIAYSWYNHSYFNPLLARKPDLLPEKRLELAAWVSLFMPLSLIIFGTTAKTHWIAPVIGAGIYQIPMIVLFQCLMLYLASIYPKYTVGIFSTNALFRSAIGGVFPLFGHRFFVVFGIIGGCGFLAGIGLLFCVALGLMAKYGDRLRARSKWS